MPIVKENIIHFSSLSLKIHLQKQNRKINKHKFDLKQLGNIHK